MTIPFFFYQEENQFFHASLTTGLSESTIQTPSSVSTMSAKCPYPPLPLLLQRVILLTHSLRERRRLSGYSMMTACALFSAVLSFPLMVNYCSPQQVAWKLQRSLSVLPSFLPGAPFQSKPGYDWWW